MHFVVDQPTGNNFTPACHISQPSLFAQWGGNAHRNVNVEGNAEVKMFWEINEGAEEKEKLYINIYINNYTIN